MGTSWRKDARKFYFWVVHQTGELTLFQNVTAAELARRLNTTPQSVQRIMVLDHATKIDTLADAFRALGKRLDFQVKRIVQAA